LLNEGSLHISLSDYIKDTDKIRSYAVGQNLLVCRYE
jgi:hypothetical protein